jgi:hypothetical protein
MPDIKQRVRGDHALKLDDSETAEIQKSFERIRSVLAKHNVQIDDVLGLVPVKEVKDASAQVKIRFAEDLASRMNMIAFD